MGAGKDGSSPDRSVGRLTPADVHHVLFTRAGLGRRGYDVVEVDVFLQRVERELSDLIGERDDLRDEVSRLRAQSGDDGPDTRPEVALTQEDAQLEAARLLAAAQRPAEAHVADAARYSERAARVAREQAEQMVADARRAAARVLETGSATREADVAASDADVGALASKEQVEQHVLQLRTLGQLVRMQLSAYLEALLRDVQEEWERVGPGAGPTPRDAEPTPRDAEPTMVDVPDAPGDEASGSGAQDADADAGRPGTPDAAQEAQARKRTVKMHTR